MKERVEKVKMTIVCEIEPSVELEGRLMSIATMYTIKGRKIMSFC